MSLRMHPLVGTGGRVPKRGRTARPVDGGGFARFGPRLAFFAASMMLLASGPGIAASACKLGKVAEWTVRTNSGQIVVDGAINGHPIGVMLDTGAARSMVLHAAAAELGLVLRPFGSVRMFGIGGETNVNAARLDEFRVGDTVRKDLLVIVGGEGDTFGNIAFILGQDFLGKVDVEFDLAHHAVRLFVARDCEGAPLAYWATNAFSAVELENSSSGEIMLTVRINERPVQTMLDSGAATTIMTKVDAARLGVTPETPGVVAVGVGGGLGPKHMSFWNGPFTSFSIGDETIKDTTIRFADLWKDMPHESTGSRTRQIEEAMPGMLLGADFLRSHRVLISNSQHRMYFTYVGGPVFSTMSAKRPTRVAPDAGAEPGDAR
jgi:predicted aspartyl protease